MYLSKSISGVINKLNEKRKNELPIETRQNIIIDARGQGISYLQEQK